MTWFDRIERAMTVVAVACALYVAVLVGIVIARLIEGGPR